MRKLESQTGVEAPSSDYPKGRIVNNQTLVNEEINGDIVQFFHRLVALAGITENTLPDNITNSFQLVTALEAVIRTFAATLIAKGTVELATSDEVDAGTDTERAITPKSLTDALSVSNGYIQNIIRQYATTFTKKGTIELATLAEVDTGTDAERAVTPKTLTDVLNTSNSNIENIIKQYTAVGTWQVPNYYGSNADYTTGGVAPLRYRKDAYGQLWIVGSCNAISSGENIFTLPESPVNYRPSKVVYFNVSIPVLTVRTIFQGYVQTDGLVFIYGAPTGVINFNFMIPLDL